MDNATTREYEMHFYTKWMADWKSFVKVQIKQILFRKWWIKTISVLAWHKYALCGMKGRIEWRNAYKACKVAYNSYSNFQK